MLQTSQQWHMNRLQLTICNMLLQVGIVLPQACYT
jgi:hypothetical protein